VRRKDNWIVFLVGVNLALLAGVVLFAYEPPAAHAQRRGGRPGDFMMTSVQVHEDYDALCVVNVPRGLMHVFIPREQGQSAKLLSTDHRNLNFDFGRGN
jgi:hypothetical protein